MNVTNVDVTPISVPLDNVVHGSYYTKDRRSTILVHIHTDEGVVGEAYSGDERNEQKEIVRLIRDEIAPIVEGRSLFSIEKIWEDMFTSGIRTGDKDKYMHAMSAVDTGIWDCVGKVLNKPLYKIWGGYRDSLPIIGIGGYYEEDKGLDGLVDEILEFQDMGLSGVKLKVGGESVARDLERLRAVEEAVDSDFMIACDANQGWTRSQAVEFAEQAANLGIIWFEEPVRWNDQYQGMREVRQKTEVPVCAGQSEISPSGCRRLLENESVDIINFDASLGGGPTAWKKAAALAELDDIGLAHHEEPHISMHLLASTPKGLFAECFHPDIDPIWHKMVEDGPRINDGRLYLPTEPGLGITLDNDFIQEYTVNDL